MLWMAWMTRLKEHIYEEPRLKSEIVNGVCWVRISKGKFRHPVLASAFDGSHYLPTLCRPGGATVHQCDEWEARDLKMCPRCLEVLHAKRQGEATFNQADKDDNGAR